MEANEDVIDLGGYPEILAHGVADVVAFGAMSEVIFFRWRKIDGVMRRVVSGVAYRPTDSLMTTVALFESASQVWRLAGH